MQIDQFTKKLAATYDLGYADGRIAAIRELCIEEFTPEYNYAGLYRTLANKYRRPPVRAQVMEEIEEARASVKSTRIDDATSLKSSGVRCRACKGSGGTTGTNTIGTEVYTFLDVCKVCYGQGVDTITGDNEDVKVSESAKDALDVVVDALRRM